MNKSNAKGYLPLVQALADGKIVQVKFMGGWSEHLEFSWDMPVSHYRIKPGPREIWVNEYPNHPSMIHPTQMDAINCAMADAITRRYREVIE